MFCMCIDSGVLGRAECVRLGLCVLEGSSLARLWRSCVMFTTSTEGHALMFVTPPTRVGIVLYGQNDLVGGRTGAV